MQVITKPNKKNKNKRKQGLKKKPKQNNWIMTRKNPKKRIISNSVRKPWSKSSSRPKNKLFLNIKSENNNS